MESSTLNVYYVVCGCGMLFFALCRVSTGQGNQGSQGKLREIFLNSGSQGKVRENRMFFEKSGNFNMKFKTGVFNLRDTVSERVTILCGRLYKSIIFILSIHVFLFIYI